MGRGNSREGGGGKTGLVRLSAFPATARPSRGARPRAPACAQSQGLSTNKPPPARPAARRPRGVFPWACCSGRTARCCCSRRVTRYAVRPAAPLRKRARWGAGMCVSGTPKVRVRHTGERASRTLPGPAQDMPRCPLRRPRAPPPPAHAPLKPHPPPPSRTNWTRLVPPPVLTGRVSHRSSSGSSTGPRETPSRAPRACSRSLPTWSPLWAPTLSS